MSGWPTLLIDWTDTLLGVQLGHLKDTLVEGMLCCSIYSANETFRSKNENSLISVQRLNCQGYLHLGLEL